MKLYNIEELVKSELEDGVFVPFDKETKEFLNTEIQEISLHGSNVEVLSGESREYHSLAELCSMLDKYSYVFMSEDSGGDEYEEL